MSPDVSSTPDLDHDRDGRPVSPSYNPDRPAGRAARPSLRAGEVRRNNTLFGVHHELAFTWAGKPARLRFVEASGAPRPVGWLRVRLGEQSVDLGLPTLPEPAWLGLEFAGIEIAALPEELLLGVLEAWLEAPITALQRQDVPLQLEGWQTTAASADACLGWEVSWNGQDRFLVGTLHTRADALNFLADLVQRAAPAAVRPADAIPFSVSVALARVPLPFAALRTVEAGDVMLLPLTKTEWTHGSYELWTGERQLARGLRQGRSLRISTMNSSREAKAPTAATDALRVDDLPVQVVFDVGQLDLTVGQLRTLQAGYTFELPAMPERLVTIRVNGREIGQGELVEVGEKIGVRIVNWSLA